MNASLCYCAGALALLVSALTASAQYLGSDNFNDNDLSNWTAGQYSVFGTNAGTLTNTGGHLEFTSTAASTQTRVLQWNNNVNASYANDWTSSVTVTNATTQSAGYNLMGLQVFSATAEYGYVGLYVYHSATQGTKILFEKGHTLDGANYSGAVTYGVGEADTTDVKLLMSFNSSTKDITLAYSLDSGATFVDIANNSVVFNPITPVTTTYGADVSAAAWYAAPTNGFSFRLLGKSSAGLEADVQAVGSGVLYADNFSVTAGQTAIPEPSTYAAMAGAMALGLAAWQRRRRAA